ncbi:MAG: biotin/lipoyl-binding protein, partial [Polyangiales bacterium]
MDGPETSIDEQLKIPRLDSSRGRTIATAVAFLVVAAGTAAYFLTRDSNRIPYRVVPVARTTVIKELQVTGHLELTDEVEVPAMVEGQLVAIFVRPGDSVEEGHLLAQLDKGSAQIAFD